MSDGVGERVRVDWSARPTGPTVPEWHDLPYGVRLRLRPLTGLAAAVIEGRMAADLENFALVLAERFGVTADDVDLLADPALASGWSHVYVSCLRAAALIADWNLGSEDGSPLPITEDNIRRLFLDGPRPGSGSVMLAAFSEAVNRPPTPPTRPVAAADPLEGEEPAASRKSRRRAPRASAVLTDV